MRGRGRSRIARGCTACSVGVVLMVGCAGCGGSSSHGVQVFAERLGHAPVKPIVRAPGARVVLVSPGPGEVVGSTFTARVRVSAFRLVRSPTGAAPVTGVGHLHFVLDGGRFDEPRFSGAAGRLAARMGVNGYYSPAFRPELTYRGIPRGAHRLMVELVNRDESTTGAASAVVRFVVR